MNKSDVLICVQKELEDCESLQSKLVNLCKMNRIKIATAESCTGGLVSYANEIKHRLLGVENRILNTFGAVSPQTAIQMAHGARKFSGSYIAVSTTGIAGPGGGTDKKPVGLVYVGISLKNREYAVKLTLGSSGKSDRKQICTLASDAALYFVIKELKQLSDEENT